MLEKRHFAKGFWEGLSTYVVLWTLKKLSLIHIASFRKSKMETCGVSFPAMWLVNLAYMGRVKFYFYTT